jgi:hypothetical protein
MPFPGRLVPPLVSLIAVVSVAVVGAPASAGGSARTLEESAPACVLWKVVDSPNQGSAGSVLTGVAATSQTDAWAVGSFEQGEISRTLAEHWDGSSWSIVPTPNVGTGTNGLGSVAALAPDDAWAVGFYDDLTTFRTLVEHWDGTSWTVVPSPNQGAGENALTSVVALATDDMWAVGYREDSSPSPRVTLAEHWDGTSWTVVPTPNVGTDENFLWSVTAASPNDVWAVGSYSVPWFQSLAEHWDGQSWTVVPTENMGDGNNVLYAATTDGPSPVTAVGTWLNGDVTATLGQHWNGQQWHLRGLPSPARYLNFLTGVAAHGERLTWAVGWATNHPFGTSRTLAESWNGHGWSVGATPNVGSESNQLAAIAPIPDSTGFWAVGHYEVAAVDHTLVEFRC